MRDPKSSLKRKKKIFKIIWFRIKIKLVITKMGVCPDQVDLRNVSKEEKRVWIEHNKIHGC